MKFTSTCLRITAAAFSAFMDSAPMLAGLISFDHPL